MVLDLSLAAGNGTFLKTFDSYMDRYRAILTTEQGWMEASDWHRIVMGTDTPEKNLSLILQDIAAL